MTNFKPYPELVVIEDPEDGIISIRTKSDEDVLTVIVHRSPEDVRRLVDCWNACRKLYSPSAHITATDDYVGRLETLRKEAWTRAEAGGAVGPVFNRDLSEAPRDGSPVILALAGKTFKSYWCKPQIDPEHWCYLTHKQTPEAWMPWPEYPGELVEPAHPVAPANLIVQQETGA